ncbi:MAG TPA: prepilin-type cleavage/methylation domain-containing protein [Bacillus bacterium]|uniref:ComG operon protein 3 n=1 Tax=Siminovitchia fordii TaxID=254759 RepID=A0ABQ4K2K0_9BACI|nr:competence type IV pilus major pilin ComGC [Siminovitchia fordii]GIN19984.1 competence protein ComGC [Siminovitchia fordii]HBZ09006.1 prepilin-type cleavage/methylation domain-containing protein [Bacillus sp. (in: firmicutes)]
MRFLIKKNEKGFTLIEMMVVLLVITVLLLIALPNITKHSSNINNKGCDGLKQMVQGQVEAYRMDKNEIPTVQQLKTEGYLKNEDLKCPNGKALTIDTANGEVREVAN